MTRSRREFSRQGSDDEVDDNAEQNDLPSTVILISIHNNETEQDELFKVLLDTGTNRCMGTQQAVRRASLTTERGQQHTY